MSKKKYDFSGYATKNDLKCSDGRTIKHNAFKVNDGQTVPLVWAHDHSNPENVLGHALLENREDGVYAFGVFNETDRGLAARELVTAGDIDSMSIHAINLKQQGSDVIHGDIKEVSLVLAGANPGAKIDNPYLTHSDEYDLEDAVIYTGELLHAGSEEPKKPVEPPKADPDKKNGDKTMKEVFATLTDEQRTVVNAMIGTAIENGGNIEHSVNLGGGELMKNNVFEQQIAANKEKKKATLTHDQLKTIFEDAPKIGSLKDSFLQHAQEYGIDPIDVLFPEAKNVTPTPEMIKRETDWVDVVLNGVSKTPFARIKSTAADITADEARAKGYVKGNLKKEEIIKLLKRITTPTTVYKKQKLDRDDIIDITDMDVVAWLKAEMRLMLNEEIAGAILVGDGREADDSDKINEDNIRPISKDDDMYAHKIIMDATISGDGYVEALLRARKFYKGSGNPVFFTTEDILTDMLLARDEMGRRFYNTVSDLASAARVRTIIPVEIMETRGDAFVGILVNLSDYKCGANKGGEISLFDDFDIDYNQYKYLMETRMSGALTKPKSAIVFKKNPSNAITPTAPTFVSATNTLTIPTVSGLQYMIGQNVVTGTKVITENTIVRATVSDDSKYIATGAAKRWSFTFTDGDND